MLRARALSASIRTIYWHEYIYILPQQQFHFVLLLRVFFCFGARIATLDAFISLSFIVVAVMCVCVWCRNVELLFKFSILSNKAGLYMRSWSIFAHSQKNACKRITTRNAKSLLCAVPSGANPGKTLRSPASLNTFLLSLFLLWLFDVIADGGHGTPHC